MTAGELLKVLEEANPHADLVARDISGDNEDGPHYEVLRAKVVPGVTRATVKSPRRPDVIELACMPSRRGT
jgi:hypothetical protein